MFTHKCHDKSSFVSVCYRYRNCSYVVSVECLSLQSFSMTTCLWYGSLSGQRGTVLRNTSYCLSLSHCFSFTGKTYVVLTSINSWFSGDAIAAISIERHPIKSLTGFQCLCHPTWPPGLCHLNLSGLVAIHLLIELGRKCFSGACSLRELHVMVFPLPLYLYTLIAYSSCLSEISFWITRWISPTSSSFSMVRSEI